MVKSTITTPLGSQYDGALPLGGAGSGNWGHAGRKGQRGGSAAGMMSIKGGRTAKARQAAAKAAGLTNRKALSGALKKVEEKINAQVRGGDPNERSYAFDGEGNQVFYRVGVGSSVTFSEDEMTGFKDMHMTHSHPRGQELEDGNPMKKGNSFSPEDIAFAAKADLAEMRAVSGGYVHVMRRPSGGWPDPESIFYRSEFRSDSVRTRFSTAIFAGQMKVWEANAAHWHTVWEEICPEEGMEYERIPYEEYVQG